MHDALGRVQLNSRCYLYPLTMYRMDSHHHGDSYILFNIIADIPHGLLVGWAFIGVWVPAFIVPC